MSSESNVQMTKPDDCSICLEPLTNNPDDRTLVTLRCTHQFHLDCIVAAYNSKNKMECPNCRHVEKGRWLSVNHSSVNGVASSSVNVVPPSYVNGAASSSINETLVSRVLYYYEQIGVPPPRFEGPLVIRENYASVPRPRTPYVPHLIVGNGNRGDVGSSRERRSGSSSGEGSSSGGDGGSSSGEGSSRSHG